MYYWKPIAFLVAYSSRKSSSVGRGSGAHSASIPWLVRDAEGILLIELGKNCLILRCLVKRGLEGRTTFFQACGIRAQPLRCSPIVCLCSRPLKWQQQNCLNRILRSGRVAMLIACVRETRIGTQCRENAVVLVPGATLQSLLRGSFGFCIDTISAGILAADLLQEQ